MKRLGFVNGVERALMHLQDERMIDTRGIDAWTAERACTTPWPPLHCIEVGEKPVWAGPKHCSYIEPIRTVAC